MEVGKDALFHDSGHAVCRCQSEDDDGRGVAIGAPGCAELPTAVGQLTVFEDRDGLRRCGAHRKGEDSQRVVEQLTVVCAGRRIVRTGEVLKEVACGEVGGAQSGSRNRHDQASDISRGLFLVGDMQAQGIDWGLSSRCETRDRLTIGNQPEHGVFRS